LCFIKLKTATSKEFTARETISNINSSGVAPNDFRYGPEEKSGIRHVTSEGAVGMKLSDVGRVIGFTINATTLQAGALAL